MKKYKIGVFGSAINENNKTIKKAKELGKELGKYKNKVIVVTGACSGMPYMVASQSAQAGLEIWGYSPEVNLKHQREFTPSDDISIYKKLIYVPGNFELMNQPLACKKYRNVISTFNCDAGIIIAGRWGSLNEFTNLMAFGKVVGVLAGTGGIADELKMLTKKIKKKRCGKVIINSSPKKLMERIIYELSK